MARYFAVDNAEASYVGGAIDELAEDERPLLAITEQGSPNVDYGPGTPERSLIGFTWLKHWRAGSGAPNRSDALSYVEHYPHWDDSGWAAPDSTDLAGEVFETAGEENGLVVVGELDLAVVGSYTGSLNLMGAVASAGGANRWLRYSAEIIGDDVVLSSNFYDSPGLIEATVPAIEPVVVMLYVEGTGSVTRTVIAISSARASWNVGFVGSRT